MIEGYTFKIIDGIHFWKNRDSVTHYVWATWKTEVEDWIKDNINDDYMLYIIPNKPNGRVVFTDEIEAMAFKLRWL